MMTLWRTLYLLGAAAICILICNGAFDHLPAIRFVAGASLALAVCVFGKVTEWLLA